MNPELSERNRRVSGSIRHPEAWVDPQSRYLVRKMPPFLKQEDTIVITCDSVRLTVEMRDAISRMSSGERNVEEEP
jgi:hypothetical protein